MFTRLFTVLLSVVALSGVASAVPSDLEARNNGGTCNSGTVMCCETIQDTSSTEIVNLFYWLNLPLPPAGTQIALTCSPVSIGGTGHGSTCTQQTVCCDGNVFYGVGTACSPIVINA